MRPRVPKSKSLARSSRSARQDGSVVSTAYYDEMMAPPAPAPDELSFRFSCGAIGSLVGRSDHFQEGA